MKYETLLDNQDECAVIRNIINPIHTFLDSNFRVDSYSLDEITYYKLVLYKSRFRLMNIQRQHEMKLLYLLNYNIPNIHIINWIDEQIYQIVESEISQHFMRPDIEHTIHFLNEVEQLLEQINQDVSKIEKIEQERSIKTTIKKMIRKFVSTSKNFPYN